MPRTKLPPTPASSTGPSPRDKGTHEMENAFSLPPAALKPSPPSSPVATRKRTLSGGAKAKDDLPPPPSRARKIIQMKPREEPPTPTTPTSATTSTKTVALGGKKKQPSATSAAGRRIARKTAHSIIERRRRSKMNEEFGVLKDMIPACKGVEMHKLAILQAGIEYVKYLQGCVEKLQDRDEPPPFHMRHDLSDENEEDEDMEGSNDQGYIEATTPSGSQRITQHVFRRESTVTTATTSTHPSPALRPNMSSSSLASQRQLPPLLTTKTYSTSPPPLTTHTPLQTGVSPAFGALQFNNDLARIHSQTYLSSTPGVLSPKMLPLPQAAMSILPAPSRYEAGSTHGISQQPQQQGDVHAEATATAALMMMGNDRRGQSSGRTGGMSVRDLLSH